MKKLILTLTASLACVAAFAQGKVLFTTDSLHLVYYGSTTNGSRGVLQADAALLGQGVASTAMPAGVTLVADLYAGAGAGASTLSLVSSSSFGATPGKWSQLSTLINSVAPGAVVSLMVQVRDSAVAAPGTINGSAPVALAGYWGVSQEFTFTTGSSVTYPAMYGANNGGTWAGGSFALDQYGAGSKGAIMVSTLVPEPGSIALAGLGLAAVTIFRRRK